MRAADVGLRRDVRDAQRRPRGARAAGADRLPGEGRPLLGGGTTPTLRLQRALGTPGGFRRWEKVLVWSHWLWFLFPHGTVAYLILRHPERFARGAARIYATFDLGLIGYWAVPTAPPWYAAAQGLMEDGRTPELRRMMVEYGEHFWRSGWAPLYGVLGGNPLAAMPSLHFATSVTAAHVLSETGPRAGRSDGPTRRCSASRSSTWASTTWSTSPPGSRSPRASARRARRHAARARGCRRAVQAIEAQARA